MPMPVNLFDPHHDSTVEGQKRSSRSSTMATDGGKCRAGPGIQSYIHPSMPNTNIDASIGKLY